MPFRIPKPHTDYALVHKIEEFLDQDYLTEIDMILPLTTSGENDGLVKLLSVGRAVRPNKRSNFVRPMFEIMPGAYSGILRSYRNPCPACDDWSRTPGCADHPEVGVERSKLGAYTTSPPPTRGSLAQRFFGSTARNLPLAPANWNYGDVTIRVEATTDQGTSAFSIEVADEH